MRKRISCVAVAALFVVASAGVVWCGEAPAAPPAAAEDVPQSDQWQFELVPMYAWALSVEGDIGVGSITAPVESSFSDILGHLEFIGTARFEGHKDRLGFFVDISYLELAMEMDGPELPFDLGPPGSPSGQLRDALSQLPPAQRLKALRKIVGKLRAAKAKLAAIKLPSIEEIDIDMTLAIIEAGLSYRFLEYPIGESETQVLTMEAYGGCRYTYLKVEQDIHINKGSFSSLPSKVSISKSVDWLEPLVGARVKCGITERLNFTVRGDVGGFGIGSASQLTWVVVTGFQYRMTELLSIYGGYKYYDLDYEGSIDMDLVLQGPIFGLAFHF